MQTYFVTGASGGIGSALCRSLAGRGARLALAGRNQEALEALRGELPDSSQASVHVLDATSTEAVDAAVDEAVSVHGGLDGAVNCVGSILLKPAHRTSAEEWRTTLSTNLDSAFALTRAAAGVMMRSAAKRGGGSIVLVSSAAARLGLANHEAIAAAKAGVIGLGQSAAASYASRGIRVNVVAPGLVRTKLAAPLLASSTNEEASKAMHALRKLGEPEDVARAIDWLLDPDQSWVTGQVLGVDGGLGSLVPR